MGLLIVLSMTMLMVPPLWASVPKPVPVVAVRASSTLPDWQGYTFNAANLIDGLVDTSWQPAKSDTLGVGQWVELDLGATHAISAIEIEQGLQKVDPKLGDLYCRNNRVARAQILFDDGTYAPVWVDPDEGPRVSLTAFFRGEALPGKEVPTTTRYIRLVVVTVLDPVDWKDLALAEIRVFGTPIEPPAADGTNMSCDGPVVWPFRVAISNYCATSLKVRNAHDCAALLDAFTRCLTFDGSAFKPLQPFSSDQIANGKVVQTFASNGSQHRVEFQRAPNGTWAVTQHHRLDAEGKPAAPVAEWLVEHDTNARNKCWEKLGKQRPEYED